MIEPQESEQGMTKEEILDTLCRIKNWIVSVYMPLEWKYKGTQALSDAIKALDQEPLTDTEKRIFLEAMGREEKICREVCADGDGADLVRVCLSIERKVKKALWE